MCGLYKKKQIFFKKLKFKTMENFKTFIISFVILSAFFMGRGQILCQENSSNFFNFDQSSFIRPQVPILNLPQNCALNAVTFDFGEINTSNNRLDLAGSYTYSWDPYHQDQKVWSNINNGNGQFAPFITVFDRSYIGSSNIDSSLRDLKFIKLRNDANAFKDLVSVKINTLIINQNIGGAINSNIYQYVPGGKGKSITTGRFSEYSSLEDVVILTMDNHIKIYKNLGTGTLSENESYYLGDFTVSKVILAQMTEKYRPELQSDNADKDDLIVFNGNNVTIYRNNGDGFDLSTPFISYNTGFVISDVAVGDINGDEYNDLIISGGNYPNYKAKAFLNIKGTGIDVSKSYWETTGYPNLASQPKILISDINKDGYNDIILVGYEQYTSIFSGANLNSTPDQAGYLGPPGANTLKIKLEDIHNIGSETLFLLYVTSPVDGDGNTNFTIQGIPSYTLNPPPGKPDIDKKTQADGNLYHPMIMLYNQGERDFASYKIYKMAHGSREYVLLASNITGNSYVDYTEYILNEDGPGQGVFNCFYKISSVDLTNQESVPSWPVGYKVGPHSCALCPININEDKMQSTNENPQFNIELKYGLTNFPNPFNPTTKIVYSIPKEGFVNISVYNILGQKIESLINEVKQKGTYLIEFNGNSLPSGIYFVKMQSGNYSEIKKINLVK